MSCSEIGTYSFELRKGDDKIKTFRYKADGAPVDLTGAVILFECPIVILQQEATILDPFTGEFTFAFSRVDTASLVERRVKYEVVIWPSGLLGNKVTLFTGTVLLQSEVI